MSGEGTALPQLATGDTVWPEEVRHLSASSISTLWTCPEKFRRQYLHREPFRPSGAMLMGTACHAAQEANYVQKIETAEDLPVADLEDAYSTKFDEEISTRGGAGEIDWKHPLAKTKDLGAGMVRPYREIIAPSVQPTAVERWFRVDVEGVPVQVVGRTDVEGKVVLADADGAPYEIGPVVIDMKFGEKVSHKLDAGARLQGLIYVMARNAHAHFHYCSHAGRVTAPPESPLVVPNNAGATLAATTIIQRAADTITDLYARYGPDEPWPGEGLSHSWACGYCSARPVCVYWAGS